MNTASKDPSCWSARTVELIRASLHEDLRDIGDLTGELLPDRDQAIGARVVVRTGGVICGLGLGPDICSVFAEHLGERLEFQPFREAGQSVSDGDAISAGQAIATVRGPKAAVLAVERTLLNFLCRLSGVATLTRKFVDAAAAANPAARILETRKTIPGWRELDRYAVRCGGGHNHRDGLYDAILIKDNHVAGVPANRLAAVLFEMLNRSAELNQRPKFVEVEVDTLDQLREVFRVVGVNIVLLDNFTPQMLAEAVRLRDAEGLRGRLELEASGGITFANVAEIAATGVDRISIGALTHSAPALDIGLDL